MATRSSPYKRILVPVDGSRTSSRGLKEALRLAKAFGAKLRVIHVVDTMIAARDAALAYNAADLILIVMGTHGRRGFSHLVLGSDAELVIRSSPAPVLLVRAPQVAKRRARGGR